MLDRSYTCVNCGAVSTPTCHVCAGAKAVKPVPIGQRGKWAEGHFRVFLKDQQDAGNVAFHRFPDARAGSFQVAPADFMFVREGIAYFIEVKEVDHVFRLPHKNFSEDQVARMRIWQLAKARTRVLVYNAPIGHWRVVPLQEFFVRTGGSWDLRQYIPRTKQEAFNLIIQ